MTTNSVLTQIEASLKSIGKMANLTPQEKLRTNGKEVMVLIESIDMEIETSNTYILTVEIVILWEESNGKELVEHLTTIITTIENGFTSPPLKFEFGNPAIEMMGEAYGITVPCSYAEIITVE